MKELILEALQYMEQVSVRGEHNSTMMFGAYRALRQALAKIETESKEKE